MQDIKLIFSQVIPYDNVFHLDDTPSPHVFLQAHVKSFYADHVVLSRAFPEHGIPTAVLPFDFVIYALGSKPPAPLDLWACEPEDNRILLPSKETPRDSQSRPPYAGSKAEAVSWLKRHQGVIQESSSILIVGAGALGVRTWTSFLRLVSASSNVHSSCSRVRYRYRGRTSRKVHHHSTFSQ